MYVSKHHHERFNYLTILFVNYTGTKLKTSLNEHKRKKRVKKFLNFENIK